MATPQTVSADAFPEAKAPREVLLAARGLTKRFAGFTAVASVDIDIVHGTIHAIIGPNGAGKTTVFNLLTKFLPPSAGTITYKGQDITNLAPSQIARLGIVRSFQISAVFPHLTVLQNVRTALQRPLGKSFVFWRPARMLDFLNARALELLKAVGLHNDADGLAGELPYGRKRALEIATTLALEPELLLLDEPTQGMGHEDVDRVMELIQQVAAGRTVVMVEHNMRVVSSIADTITVLSRGEVIAEGDYSTVSSDPTVIEAYMGTSDPEDDQW